MENALAILLPARSAQTLALVMHELATNAAKYGALSVASGRIAVTWDIAVMDGADRRVALEWLESRGPPANAPVHKGFGTAIIASVAGSEFKCAPSLCYAPAGLHYRPECALSALIDRQA